MSKRILIVEDDPDGQALVAHVVDHLRIEYDIVSDAEQALQQLNDYGNRYQAVLIDLALPGQNGWDLLAAIRHNDAIAGLTCVAVTGFHSSKTREDALKAGFDAYFAKPLDAAHFARELASLL